MTLKRGSTGKVLRGAGGKLCRTCCGGFPIPYADIDCCCFLDPDTETYDVNTTYGNGDLCETSYKTWESQQSGNLGQNLNDPDWWKLVSSNENCGNENWNSVGGLGGPGRTAGAVKVVVTNAWPPISSIWASFVRPNGTYILDVFGTGGSCRYNGNNGLIVGGPYGGMGIGFQYEMNRTKPDATKAAWFGMWTVGEEETGTKCIINKYGPACGMGGTFIGDGNPDASSCGGYTDTIGAKAVVTLLSSVVVNPWRLSHAYVIGIMVSHDSVWYDCIADHTSSADDEPGVGVNWMDNWHLVEYVTNNQVNAGELQWNEEPNTSCVASTSISMSVVKPNDVAGYAGAVWEYLFLVSDSEYAKHDSGWSSSKSYTAGGLPSASKELGSPAYCPSGYCTAHARLKLYPWVVASSAPQRGILMHYNLIPYVINFDGDQINTGDGCSYYHVGGTIRNACASGGYLELGDIQYRHRALVDDEWTDWTESSWFPVTDAETFPLWDTPTICGYPQHAIEARARNNCGDGPDWDDN